MYYLAQLILNNYIPLQIEEGMLFKNVLYPNTEREIIELWKINLSYAKYMNGKRLDEFFTKCGYPVELSIIDGDGILAISDQIGWWDEGEQTEDLRDITLTDINRILQNNGDVEIDISEEAFGIHQIIPTVSESKVILRIPIDVIDEDDIDDLFTDNIPNEKDYGDDISNEEMFGDSYFL